LQSLANLGNLENQQKSGRLKAECPEALKTWKKTLNEKNLEKP